MTSQNEMIANEQGQELQKNEIEVSGVVYNTENGEMKQGEVLVRETNDYKIVQLPNGDFKKNMKYHEFWSRQPETEEDQFELYKVMNDSTSNRVTPLRNMVGKEISLQHVFIQPYESFDEKTGNVTSGVTCTIQSVENDYYATSSKTVYHKLADLFKSFGTPGTANFKPLKLKVIGTKQKNGVQIDLELIGRA